MTKLVLGWSLVLSATVGCTTTVSGGSETGGGIQDPDASAIAAPDGDGGAGGSPSVATTSGTSTSSTSASGAGGAPPSTGSVVPGPEVDCPEHARTILLRMQGGTPGPDFVRFDPVTHAVTPIPLPPCTVDTLAVGRDGSWWTTTGQGIVRRVDTVAGTCTDVADLTDAGSAYRYSDIGMARDAAGSADERLWVATMDTNGLGPTKIASVDLASGVTTAIAVVGDGDFLQMSLTGTADGRLIGIGQTNGPTEPGNAFNMFVVDIDRTDGSVRWKTPISVEAADPLANSIGSAFWGDALYIFLGNTEDAAAPSSTVIRHMLDGSAPDTVVATIDGAVISAASTPCDDLAAP